MEGNRPNRERLVELGYSSSVIFENPDFDSAIIGVSFDGNVIYDFNLMVKHLMDEDGMTEEEAIEFIDYNTVRSLPYQEKHPIIMKNYCEE